MEHIEEKPTAVSVQAMEMLTAWIAEWREKGMSDDDILSVLEAAVRGIEDGRLGVIAGSLA